VSPRKSPKLALTQAALVSINELEQYSIENWGKKVAGRYIDDLEAGLIRIQEQPDLLRSQPEFHSDFCFYRVNKHLLVCDRQLNSIIVLAVIHAAQDIPDRLADLEPTLAKEVESLHEKLKTSKRKK
jgi:plasmid stabilization system protein ParE